MHNNNQSSSFRTLLFCALFSLTMAACGGGGGGGSDDNPVVDDPPDAAPPPPPPEDPPSKPEASRFLIQTTFGPNAEEIDRVEAMGYEDWIDDQMAKSVTTHLSYLDGIGELEWNDYINGWWTRSLRADDQLRQRVAFALSEIFVISSKSSLGGKQRGLANYYDLLARNAFGNYRTLLEDVTLNPMMGEYLSMKSNQKPDPDRNIRPDENYAREVLQLFSTGLVELNLNGSPRLDADGNEIPIYDQAVVEGFAHVFTGWNYVEIMYWNYTPDADYLSPMVAYPDYHDEGEKTLLNGFVVPAGQTAEEDMAMALDNIFNHPSVGPFIVKQLIQRLITSNPSPDYVARIASVFNDNGSGVRGDMAAVIKAMLLDDEARNGHLNDSQNFGKLKEPLLRLTQLWRAFDAGQNNNEFDFKWVDYAFGQAPLGSPSVFNFFHPDYSQQGILKDNGLLSPEFEIHNETSVVKLTNHLMYRALWSHNFRDNRPDDQILLKIDDEVALADDLDAVLDRLDLLLLAGSMSADLRNEARILMESRNADDPGHRVGEAIYLIVTSPEYAIQK